MIELLPFGIIESYENALNAVVFMFIAFLFAIGTYVFKKVME